MHQSGLACLAFVAHHTLITVFDQKPIKTVQILAGVFHRGHGLPGGHPLLLAATLGIEVEGIQPFAIGQYGNGGELMRAAAAHRRHDLLQWPAGFWIGAVAGEAAQVDPPAELIPQGCLQGCQHQGQSP